MQNRYVGDVGDFGTYGLLRAVVGAQPGAIGTRLRLGVHWCLVPDETHNDDGKHIDYLARSKENLTRFRVCDPQLFDRLGAVLSRGRNVATVEQGDVLPADTRYFSRPLSFQDLHGRPSREARLSRRAEWSEAAVRELRQCEVVFLDPDNGLEGQTARHALSGPKYVYHDELRAFAEPGRSLVVYHHLDRKEPAVEQIRSRTEELKRALNLDVSPMALRFRRGSARLFLIAASDDHVQLMTTRVQRLLRGPWRHHFEAPLGPLSAR